MPMSPTTPCSTQRPSRQAQISLFPHPSPPTEGAVEPRARGERQFTSKVPIGEGRPPGQGSCSLHSQASMPKRALGSQALCAHPSLKQILGPPRVEELPREAGSVPTSGCMPQESAESKDTSHSPGSQRLKGRGRAWVGTHRRRAAECPTAPPSPPVLPPAAALAAVAAVLPVILVGVPVVRVVVGISPVPAVVIASVAATVSPVIRSPVRGTVVIAAVGQYTPLRCICSATVLATPCDKAPAVRKEHCWENGSQTPITSLRTEDQRSEVTECRGGTTTCLSPRI